MLENGLIAGSAALSLALLAYFLILRPIMSRGAENPHASPAGPTHIPRNLLLLGLIIAAVAIVTLIVLTGARVNI